MKQICYRCGRELDKCECEAHMRMPGHKASREDGQAFARNYPREMLDYMLQSDCLADILQALEKHDPESYQHMACCAAEAYADNHGIERIG